MDHAQRVATEIALSVLSKDGFILAGGQALAEHGVTDRVSKDVDLFALHRQHTPETFAASVRKMTTALETAGYTVEITRQYQEFASLTVDKDGTTVVMDLGLDWWENKPAIVDFGPVLSLDDSVAAKLIAVYSRGYARDYLDAYSILTSGRFTHQQLIALCHRRDPHLDLGIFATSITRYREYPTLEYTKYGLPASELTTLANTLDAFARTIQHNETNTTTTAPPADPAGPGTPDPGIDLH
ncbi:nucleotidyl transferase AbiEii/AbiGii toxin family protein [Arthrobacter sp. efr-133-TYG-118]|uniref:nucleotidyl transferase AbiEii/AbiGii toxin family protein n=1 Tax=Arthrobacter sp. efr-133-TYG-118 TaxID=3040279 RepID=UPI0025513D44|nr:nucleotidyl transferase AbiEii/AbiGii toxin family protein [Arthrobacter sp. efr-133-TYG-118]